MSLRPPPNIQGPLTLPIAPPINIPNTPPIYHTPIDTILYPRNATYTYSSRRPPFSSADQTDNRYQVRRSNIPGHNNNYSNIIQNHALKDRQCHVSGTLDHKRITILINTGSSICLLDEQLYCSLSFVPTIQPIQFQIQGQKTGLLLHWV